MKTFSKQIASMLMVLILTVGLSVTAMAAVICPNCDEYCTYDIEYEQWGDTYHTIRGWCSECGEDIYQGTNAGVHKMSGGECTLCGYSEICYHNYTDIDWNGCEWEEYCEDCGEILDYGIDHGSTYTEWDGCDWYEYCDGCDELVDSGTDHGSYSYGAWEYYNSSRHYRLYACDDCGEGSYDYGYHSTTSEYSQYSSTQHKVGSYCSTCSSYIGSTTYESHDFSYGSWSNYSGSQHRRSVYCSDCGYSNYEYASHSLSYGSWTSYSSTQHKRTVSCSGCSYSTTEYADHSITTGDWTSISDTQHSRTASCDCGHTAEEPEDHTFSYGDWTESSASGHSREISCDCGYIGEEYDDHTDEDFDGFCDICDAVTSRFSVTVPAYLLMVLSQDGTVYAAASAEITNHSTAAVAVTDISFTTGSGWTLVPYTTDMANEKVDSRQIGFLLNGMDGYGGTLETDGRWVAGKNSSIPLTYDAVVSATSDILTEEQVLTIVFVLDWAV